MKKILLSTIFLYYCFTSMAQTLQDATTAYNDAIKSLQEQKYEAAVQDFIKAYNLAIELEDEGAFDVQMGAKKQICETYLKIANAYYQKSDFKKAYENMELAIANSEKYEEAATQQKALGALPVLAYQSGNVDLKAEKLDEALAEFKKAVELNPKFDPAYIGIAIVLSKQDKIEEALESYDQAIAIAQEAGKSQVVLQHKRVGYAYATKLAQELKNKNELQKALLLFEKALGYDNTNPDVGYLAAETASKLDKNDQALEFAEQALLAEKRESEEGKILYLMANSYKALNQKDKVCETLKKLVKHEMFKKNAEYELKQLKCS